MSTYTTKQLTKLAEFLTYKADIYTDGRRIYSFQHPFRVEDGKLFHGPTELDPARLFDGHGRPITP